MQEIQIPVQPKSLIASLLAFQARYGCRIVMAGRVGERQTLSGTSLLPRGERDPHGDGGRIMENRDPHKEAVELLL